MKVGVPRELKTHEYRVGLTPTSVRELVAHGHDVLVEKNAGIGIGAADAAYEKAGARIVGDVFAEAELIVKVKEPQPQERKRLREGQVLFSLPEREAFGKLIGLGLKDAFRLFEQPERSFTWWDYRMNAFRRKMGLRIDHVLLSEDLAKACTACTIDIEPRRNERPSDHAPVIVEIIDSELKARP